MYFYIILVTSKPVQIYLNQRISATKNYNNLLEVKFTSKFLCKSSFPLFFCVFNEISYQVFYFCLLASCWF